MSSSIIDLKSVQVQDQCLIPGKVFLKSQFWPGFKVRVTVGDDHNLKLVQHWTFFEIRSLATRSGKICDGFINNIKLF